MPRGAQVIYPKDLGPILIMADVFPGARIFESGLGSGALSMALLRAGAEITGYELRTDFAERAQINVAGFLGTAALERYHVHIRDAYDGIDETGLDRVVLDLPEPWRMVKAGRVGPPARRDPDVLPAYHRAGEHPERCPRAQRFRHGRDDRGAAAELAHRGPIGAPRSPHGGPHRVPNLGPAPTTSGPDRRPSQWCSPAHPGAWAGPPARESQTGESQTEVRGRAQSRTSVVIVVVVIVAVAVAAAVGGYRLGFLGRVASWLGLGSGLLPGRPRSCRPSSSGSIRPLPGTLVALAVIVLVGGAMLGQAVGLIAGSRLHRALPLGPVRQVDRAVGAGVGALGVLVVLWLLIPSLAAVPGWPARAVSGSGISRWVSRDLPVPPDALQVVRRLIGNDAPQVFAVLQPGVVSGTPPAASPLGPGLDHVGRSPPRSRSRAMPVTGSTRAAALPSPPT